MGGTSELTRRLWLRGLLASWPAVVAAQQHAHHAASAGAGVSTKLEYFDARAAAEVEALTETILPSGATPGAREAGAVYFIDRALATFDKDKRAVYHDGLAELDRRRAAAFPASVSFAALDGSSRETLIRGIEHGEFFELVRFHTLAGFLANPSYGGNRGGSGWRLIGFDDSFHFEPPFGYYDGPGSEG